MAKIKSLNPKKEAAFKMSGPEAQKVARKQLTTRPPGTMGGFSSQSMRNTPYRNAPDLPEGTKVKNVSSKYPDHKQAAKPADTAGRKVHERYTKDIKRAQDLDVKNARAGRAASALSTASKISRATNAVGVGSLVVEGLNAAKSAYTSHKTESNFNKMASNPPAKTANHIADSAASSTMSKLPVRVNPSNNSSGDARRPDATKKLKK